MEKTLARADTLADLRRLLGAKGCLEGADLPERNRTDWSFLPATDPIAVLRPTSTDEVAQILRHCHANAIPP